MATATVRHGYGSHLEGDGMTASDTDDNTPIDRRMLAAARALWATFDYDLPLPPADVARIALDAADHPERWGA